MVGRVKQIVDALYGRAGGSPSTERKSRWKTAMGNRRSMRLHQYDYTQSGVYFVTICAYRFRRLFGRIVNGSVQLNSLGRLVEDEWQRTAAVRHYVEIDLYVVMPNHLHGLLFITHNQSEQTLARSASMQSNSLGSIIAQFKSIVTKRSRILASPRQMPIWKRNYYDHIVRNERSLERIRNYILENPARWSDDRFYRD